MSPNDNPQIHSGEDDTYDYESSLERQAELAELAFNEQVSRVQRLIELGIWDHLVN